ncbi:hypothetical protein GGR22_001636 [Flavobacterium gossypii]|uniref:Uncharacterized protein n=1 Tax=Flavobacterium gossypii TaxID=1646119 RepID=A0ABR6DP89_9FLAO|nr:hypothetical protein [Flavobacterium gossypii]
MDTLIIESKVNQDFKLEHLKQTPVFNLSSNIPLFPGTL